MKNEETKIPKELEEIVKKIEEMKTKDLATLVKILEEKFGVLAQIPAQAPAAAPPSVSEVSKEKAEFDVILKKYELSKKIQVIKAIKEITGKGLKDSKDFVELAEREPQIVKKKIKKEEAEEIKKKLTEAGAEIEIK